jgi:glycosyltransferase involved in cell wall biosynthesis
MKNVLTIALPVYKRTDFVKSALDSAVNQTVECSILLIDNNSPHHDFKTIVDSYHNPNIRYVRTTETVPQDENFNNCFRFAETPWVTVLHDDDMLHVQYVEFCRKIMDRFGERVGGFVYLTHVGEEEWKEVGQMKELTADIKKLRPAYFQFHNIPFPGVLVKKDTALKLGGFKKELHPIADFDFWLRYSKQEQLYFINQEMAYFRISPTQSTNHLIKAMINNIYSYRLEEIRQSGHNNALARLGLEHARNVNIDYFRNTYTEIEIPEEIVNRDKMQRSRRILKNPLIRKLVEKYINYLSFSKA